VLNVTVRCGLVGVVLFVLLPPDMDDISGVVSVELDAIVIRGLNFQRCRNNWTIRSVRYTPGVSQKEKSNYGPAIEVGEEVRLLRVRSCSCSPKLTR
jgi:hypothetical protein